MASCGLVDYKNWDFEIGVLDLLTTGRLISMRTGWLILKVDAEKNIKTILLEEK
jgi:hypothetical protein